VATMPRHGVDDILTFDSGFDAVGGLRRLPG
jgi:predicted nucleic acid-binding protein